MVRERTMTSTTTAVSTNAARRTTAKAAELIAASALTYSGANRNEQRDSYRETAVMASIESTQYIEQFAFSNGQALNVYDSLPGGTTFRTHEQPCMCNTLNQTALHYACGVGHGIKVSGVPLLEYCAALQEAVEAQESPADTMQVSQPALSQCLFHGFGCTINSSDIYGNTPLHYLAMCVPSVAVIDALREMIGHGANPAMRNLLEYTPFQVAHRCGHMPFCDVLYSSGDLSLHLSEPLSLAFGRQIHFWFDIAALMYARLLLPPVCIPYTVYRRTELECFDQQLLLKFTAVCAVRTLKCAHKSLAPPLQQGGVQRRARAVCAQLKQRIRFCVHYSNDQAIGLVPARSLLARPCAECSEDALEVCKHCHCLYYCSLECAELHDHACVPMLQPAPRAAINSLLSTQERREIDAAITEYIQQT